jgi:hypothetical protein
MLPLAAVLILLAAPARAGNTAVNSPKAARLEIEAAFAAAP